jgi:hypothetical protein
LPKPEGDEELLAEIVRTREAGLALSDQIGDAVRDKEASRIRTLVGELESLQNRIDGDRDRVRLQGLRPTGRLKDNYAQRSIFGGRSRRVSRAAGYGVSFTRPLRAAIRLGAGGESASERRARSVRAAHRARSTQ